MENRTPAFYAVIPASVRYDTELRPNAKLLYGELSALATQEGYCWAKNKYFADLFGLSQKTISELLKQLAEHGHIRIEVIRDPETQEVIQRRLWIAGPSGAAVPPSSEKSGEGGYPENSGETSSEKNGDPPPKNREENYTSLSNPSKNNPPISPQGGRRRRTGEHYKPKAFESLYAYYPRHVGKAAAQKAWDKLRPSPEIMEAICVALKVQKAYWLATQTPKDKIPHLSTWLNGQRWTDDPDDYIPPDSVEKGGGSGGWAPDPEVM